jgi:mannose-6-phosphate isomerase-like protein (cupin superfamily)
MPEPETAAAPDISSLPDDPDVIAPDGSEIRFLESNDPSSSMVHALLRPGATTQAVQHRAVVESWVCIGGQGELWRASEQDESVIVLKSGVTCNIPLGTRFQFRSSPNANHPLEIIITTTPPWPGEQEAFKVQGKWKPCCN